MHVSDVRRSVKRKLSAPIAADFSSSRKIRASLAPALRGLSAAPRDVECVMAADVFVRSWNRGLPAISRVMSHHGLANVFRSVTYSGN